MVDVRAPVAVWRSVRAMPEFGRLLAVRIASQFGDGLFHAGLAGAILFNPDRAATPWAIAGSFAVLFLPYSLLGPFAGALLDRWDRRYVLVGANAVADGADHRRRRAVGARCGRSARSLPARCWSTASAASSPPGLSAALPHVVPREQVVTMNAVATAVGAVATLRRRQSSCCCPAGCSARTTPVLPQSFSSSSLRCSIALLLALRFASHSLGPDDTARTIHGSAFYAVATGWLHGLRTVAARPVWRRRWPGWPHIASRSGSTRC